MGFEYRQFVHCGNRGAIYLLDYVGFAGEKTVGGRPVQGRATP